MRKEITGGIPGKRVEWLDFIRGIAMLLVITGYSQIPDPYWTAIYTFHMPLFYMITGCCYKERKLSFSEQTARAFKKLIKPYLAFSALGIAITFAFPNIYGFPVTEAQLKQFLHGVFIARGSFDFTGSWGAIWFLVSEFWLLLFVYVLSIGRLPSIIAGCIAGPIATYYKVIQVPHVNDHGWLIWSTGASLMAIPIFYMGVLYMNSIRKHATANKDRRIVSLCAGLVLVAVSMWISLKNTGIVAFTSNYYGDIWHMLAGALGTPLGLIMAVNCIYELVPAVCGTPLFKAIEWVGKNTLLFLGTHGMLLYLVQSVWVGISWYEAALIVFVVCCIIIQCWNSIKKLKSRACSRRESQKGSEC